MVLQAFHDDEVYALVAAISLGYGILNLTKSKHIEGLNQTRLILESTAVGLLVLATLLVIVYAYLKDNRYLRKEEKSEIWDKWFHWLTMGMTLVGVILISLTIYL